MAAALEGSPRVGETGGGGGKPAGGVESGGVGDVALVGLETEDVGLELERWRYG